MMGTARADLCAGIDVGTSGVKVVVIDRKGSVLRTATTQYELAVPHPGWAEQSPADWWAAVTRCLDQVGWDVRADSDRIGVTGQMHGAVCLDGEGAVLRPAILWNDQRTVAECEMIRQSVGLRRVRAITGSPPLTGFQLPKLLWIREHERAAYDEIRSVLLPKDYIRWRLGDRPSTEPTDASGTGAFDIRSGRWSQTMLDTVGVDASLFPVVRTSVETRGAGDQAAAAVGTGAVREGIVSICLGTSGVVFTALDQLPRGRNDAVQLGYHANGRWHAMTVMLSCGGALRWWRDCLDTNATYESITDFASTAPPGCDGLTFLPYLSGERSPHNDPNARGAFVGLTLQHGRAALTRALLEGVTFGLCDGLRALTTLTGVSASQVRVTGGGAQSLFWRQLIADVCQVPCVTVGCDEGPAYGAAMLAGVSVGWWPTVEVASDETISLRSFTEPSGVDYRESYERYRSLYPAIRPWGRE